MKIDSFSKNSEVTHYFEIEWLDYTTYTLLLPMNRCRAFYASKLNFFWIKVIAAHNKNPLLYEQRAVHNVQISLISFD